MDEKKTENNFITSNQKHLESVSSSMSYCNLGASKVKGEVAIFI